MCPAGDNQWDEDAMYETFLFTNICPQDHELNSGLWNDIEQRCRTWANRYGDVYIVCGPVYTDDDHETMGPNKVAVPDAFFKVVLCTNGTAKGIGFICPNEPIRDMDEQYVKSIDEVESITGIDFFPALPDDVEQDVESHADLGEW